MERTNSRLTGVLTVLPTPFHHDGGLDLGSLTRLVEHSVDRGSAGVVCFGLAGENYKLSDDERRAVLSTVIDSASGRIPVIAGTESSSFEVAVQRTAEAIGAGVAGVMVLPPSFVRPDARGIVEYYTTVAVAAAGRPVIVQDAPAWTGVLLPLELLVEIRDRTSNVGYVKVENPPSAPKIRALVAEGFSCIGGYGALHLLEDHSAGITAIMPGAGHIEHYVALWSALQRDDAEAWRLFTAMLPLLSFQMSSLEVFVAVQKEVLVRRGVIATSAVRRPGRQLDADQLAWLDRILARVDSAIGETGQSHER